MRVPAGRALPMLLPEISDSMIFPERPRRAPKARSWSSVGDGTVCSVQPASVNVNTTPSQPTALTITLQTNTVAHSAVERQPPSTSRSLPLFAAISGIVPLALWGSKELRKGSRRRRFAVRWAGKSALAYSAFLLVLALWLTGCGGNSYSANFNAPSTPPGTYQLPVVATAPGGVQQSINLTVRVL